MQSLQECTTFIKFLFHFHCYFLKRLIIIPASLSLEMYPVTSNSSIYLSFFSPRRKCLYLMELSSLRKRPRMPGLVMHWQLLQTSTTMASLTCWWEPRWRMSTGAPSTSTTETVFTSSTITSRYLSFADIYIFTGAFENSIKLISD